MIWLTALLVAALILPHTARDATLSPATGIVLWLSALTLRALLAVSVALLLVLFVPATDSFQIVTNWCMHAVVPFLATHLGFSGHRLGEMAVLAPSLVLTLSAVWALFALWRAAEPPPVDL